MTTASTRTDIGIIVTAVLLGTAFFLGTPGLLVLLLFALLAAPAYLVLDTYLPGTGEKLIYSAVIGAGIVSGLIYWTGVVLPFSWAAILVVAFLLAAGWWYRARRLRSQSPKKSSD